MARFPDPNSSADRPGNREIEAGRTPDRKDLPEGAAQPLGKPRSSVPDADHPARRAGKRRHEL